MWGNVARRTDSYLEPRSCALRFFRTSARRGEGGCHPEGTLRPDALGEHGSATSRLDSNLPSGRDSGRDDGRVRERPDNAPDLRTARHTARNRCQRGEGFGEGGVRDQHMSAMGGEGGRAGSLATPRPNPTSPSGPPSQPRLEPCASQQRRQDDHSPPPPPPRELVHAPATCWHGGWGARGGGLGLGPRVLGGVVVG